MENADDGENGERGERDPPETAPLVIDIKGGYSADDRASEKKREYEIADRVALWTQITGIGTVIAAILAAVAAGIFWEQLGTMQAQLTAQETDFRIDERPILTAEEINIPGNAIRSGPVYDKMLFGWNYGVKNIGKGTAIDVRMFEYVSILGSPFIGLTGGVGRTEPDVGPTNSFWSTAFFGSLLTEDRYALAKSKTNEIVVKVILAYKDVFGTVYRSPICLATHPNGSVGNCLVSQFSSLTTDGEHYEKDYK